jgi:NitT/TauT family transport system permease protein
VNNRLTQFAARRADVISGAAVLVAWFLIAEIWHPLWLPTLPSVVGELWTLISDGSLSFLGATGSTLLVGLVVTFAISAVVAVLMASSEIIEEALLPFVNGFLAVPHIALIPMFTFIWGNGELTRILTTISFALSPVILTWTAALKSSPADLSEMALSFGAGRLARGRYVRMPAAIAPIIAGLRIGVVQGVKGVVSAEVIIGVVGVGKLISTASATFNISELYAVVIIIVAISIVFYLLFTVIENRITQWNN